MRKITELELKKAIQSLEVFGYAKITNVMDSKEVQEMEDKVNFYYQNVGQKVDYQGRPARDFRDKMIYNLQNKDKYFIDLLDNPDIKEILKYFLNDPYYRFLPPEKPNYTLSYYNARSSGEFLDLHIDSHIPMQGDKTFSMQCIFIVNEFSESNGCSIAIPGSHKSGKYTDRSLGAESYTKLFANPGDVVLWDSRLWHGTLENISGKDRWALIATIVSWWVKPAMNMTQSLPQEIYSKLSDEQKSFIGFCSIPPKDEFGRVNTKTGYEFLKSDVKEYYK
jgi:ectoine hydroxylase-related dioxygenase (phytanoyl-CoA dioxygenase family)